VGVHVTAVAPKSSERCRVIRATTRLSEHMKVSPDQPRLKADGDVSAERPALRGAFGVLTALRQRMCLRVSELELGGLPRTTVRRLLIRLETLVPLGSTGERLVIHVLPARRRLAFEPELGIALAGPRPGLARAGRQARGTSDRSRAAASEPKDRTCRE